MFQVTVNENKYSFEEGKSILDVLKAINLSIPTLCYDQRLPAAYSCRTCLVRVNGEPKLLPSCMTKISEGMRIETHLPDIEEYRKSILRLMAKKYSRSTVRAHPEKEFHLWLNHYGITDEMDDNPTGPVDHSNPYMDVDMSRCISCFRCVSICNKIQGQFVWHIVSRGDRLKIISDSKDSFHNSSCVSCGACADTCPTGAIEDKNVTRNGLSENTVKTVCAYCAVGCEIEVGVKKNMITGIHPVTDSPVNRGHLCVKGRYAWEYSNSGDRITKPMIRRNGEWKVVSWDEALQYCSRRLLEIAHQYGPDSIGILGSARATNEDNYLIQKFARTVIGTNNVDCCARVCHHPTAKAMSMVLGTGAATNSFNDIEMATTFLLAGTNACENHPVVGARIKQMARKGANLIVVDPRKTEFTRYAKYHLQLKAGTNIPLFNAMAQVIVEDKLYDQPFIEKRIDGWNEYKKLIQQWTPEFASKICRVHPRLIREASRMYAKNTPSICFHGLGMTEHTQGTDGVIGLINLALLTGNIGRAGTGINPLRGQNNVQGSSAMGCDPAVYTGMASVEKEKSRFERLWQTSLPGNRGLSLPEMLNAAMKGSLRSMWIVGYDISLTMSDANRTQEALENLDFTIVQDMFMNETARKFADVFLPVATSFEKEGTFMNSERRIQKLRKVVSPPNDVLADWEIVCRLADEMGKKDHFAFSSPQGIWNEVRKVWSAVYGVTYERLEPSGIQWPCPTIDHPGTEILHQENFTIGRKARLMPLDFMPTREQVSEMYPHILITGRELYHFNSGTMTYRTPNKDILNTDFLHIHPHDAHQIGLKANDLAKLVSLYGETELPVVIDPAVRKGEVFATFNDRGVFLNKLTSPLYDSYVQTPEYKVTAVRVEKIDIK